MNIPDKLLLTGKATPLFEFTSRTESLEGMMMQPNLVPEVYTPEHFRILISTLDNMNKNII